MATTGAALGTLPLHSSHELGCDQL